MPDEQGEKRKNKKILVSGASGFIGRTLLEQLQTRADFEISGLVGEKTALENFSVPGIRLFPADISNYEAFPGRGELKKTDVFVHAAGLAHQFGKVSRADFWRVNVKGTENVCRLAHEIEVEHFILISSVAVYGNYGKVEIDESFACRPADLYADSKLESEKKAREFCEGKGISLTILRPATVIGEGDRGNTTRLIRALEKGRFLWIGDGSNQKSLIYKGDVAKAIQRVAEQKPLAGTKIFNLTGEAVTMRQIVETIAASLGRKAPRLSLPANLLRGVFRFNKFPFEGVKKLERAFEKWLSDDVFSGREFREKFSFAPSTAVSDALRQQVNYYLKQKPKI
jgi:nucleoside-diphosphate-sugar epimerase